MKKNVAICLLILYVLIPKKRPLKQANGQYTYAVILGAKVKKGGIPTKALQNRLDQAVSYGKKYPHIQFITTGGQGFDEDTAEASVMQKYLIEHGIAAQRIIVEDRSTSTYENILFTKEKLPNVKELTIISNDYHLKRACLLAEQLGFQVDTIQAKTPKEIQRKVKMRERAAYIKAYILKK